MIYIPTILAVIMLPLAAGYLKGRRLPPDAPARTGRALAWAIGATTVWLGLSWATRYYAETDRLGWGLAEAWAHKWRWLVFAMAMSFFIGLALTLEEVRTCRRRIVLSLATQLLVIFVVVWRTIPVYTSLPRGTRRDEKGYIRQTVEYTCGPVSLANLMEQSLGMPNQSERDAARLSGTTREGTAMRGLKAAARKYGLRVVDLRILTMEELESFGGPAIVSISTLPEVRHATLFLRFEGETAHFIDPSYGYRERPREWFERVWYGKTLIVAAP